jgi:hypothetical protein
LFVFYFRDSKPPRKVPLLREARPRNKRGPRDVPPPEEVETPV